MTLSLTTMLEMTTPVPPSRPPSGKEAGVDEDAAFDFVNAFGGDGFGEFFDDGEGIACDGGTAVRVIFIDEGESAVGLDAIGKIGVAAGDEDEIALQSSFFVDGASAINDGVEAVVGAKLCEDSAFGESFGRGGGNK